MNISSKELQKKSGIYVLSILDKQYVGSSKNLYSRLIEHRSDLKNNIHGNDYLQNVFNKHGVEKLNFEILQFCEPEERLLKEKEWIDKINPCLNLISDPLNPKMTGYSKAKLSKAVLLGIKEGRYKTKFDFMEVEQYDYMGEYVNSFKNQKEAAEKLGLTLKRANALLSGYRKGVASNGIRLRYKESLVPVQKFKINVRSLSRNLQFYSENNSEEVAFNGLKDMYDFLLQSVIEGKKEIVIKYKQKQESQLGPL